MYVLLYKEKYIHDQLQPPMHVKDNMLSLEKKKNLNFGPIYGFCGLCTQKVQAEAEVMFETKHVVFV